MDGHTLKGSDLAKLAFLLRLAAMTGREIAARQSTDRDEILELIDRAEDVGRRLDEIASREMRAPETSSIIADLSAAGNGTPDH